MKYQSKQLHAQLNFFADTVEEKDGIFYEAEWVLVNEMIDFKNIILSVILIVNYLVCLCGNSKGWKNMYMNPRMQFEYQLWLHGHIK